MSLTRKCTFKIFCWSQWSEESGLDTIGLLLIISYNLNRNEQDAELEWQERNTDLHFKEIQRSHIFIRESPTHVL